MRLVYVLLSPTFGMHQYTADLANRMAELGHEIHLVTTSHAVLDRYSPDVIIHALVKTTNTGLSLGAIQPAAVDRSLRSIRELRPDVVHFTGPHLWNAFLVPVLTARGIPTVHSLHDLHPHAGAFYGRLLYLWNGWVQRKVTCLLVHGRQHHEMLLAQGVAQRRLTCTPLLHLFLSYAQEQKLNQCLPPTRYEPWALFLGRLELYKGLHILVEAAGRIQDAQGRPVGVVIAGRGALADLIRGSLPANVEVRNRHVGDDEAVDLFSRCGLVVLPYIEASQSALVAAAYFFQKPVIVAQVGALPEYVVEGETGWVIPPADPEILADRLEAALADPAQLARMGQAGRAWYEGHRRSEQATLQEMYESCRVSFS